MIFCKNAKTWVPAHNPNRTCQLRCSCEHAPCDDAAHSRSMARHGRQVHTRRVKSAPHGHFSFNVAFIMLVQTTAGGLGCMRIALHSCADVPPIVSASRSLRGAPQVHLGLQA